MAFDIQFNDEQLMSYININQIWIIFFQKKIINQNISSSTCWKYTIIQMALGTAAKSGFIVIDFYLTDLTLDGNRSLKRFIMQPKHLNNLGTGFTG